MAYILTRFLLMIWCWGIVIFAITLVSRIIYKDKLPFPIGKMLLGTLAWPLMIFSKNGRKLLFKNINKLK